MYSEGRIRVNSTSGMIGGKRLRLNLLSPRIVLARSEPTGRCCIFGANFDAQLANHFAPSSEKLNDWRSIGLHLDHQQVPPF